MGVWINVVLLYIKYGTVFHDNSDLGIVHNAECLKWADFLLTQTCPPPPFLFLHSDSLAVQLLLVSALIYYIIISLIYSQMFGYRYTCFLSS